MCDSADTREPPAGMPDDVRPAGVLTVLDEPRVAGGARCVKCKQRPATISINQASFCEYARPCAPGPWGLCSECFVEQACAKYRQATGRARTRRDTPQRVLVALSTGSASRLLLHLTQTVWVREPRRASLDEFVYAHVTDGPDGAVESLRGLVRSYGQELHEVPLARVTSVRLDGGPEAADAARDAAALDALLGACRAPSDRVDLVRVLRRVLLACVARSLGCTRVFLGETGLRLAINVIADMSAGRGAAVPWAMETVQTSAALPGLGVVRPLRDLQGHEVPAFLRLAGIAPGPPAEEPASPGSIYGLTEHFISGLAQSFAATPNNVTRTAAKVSTAATAGPAGTHCALCLGPVAQGDGRCCYGCTCLARGVAADLGALLPYTRSQLASQP